MQNVRYTKETTCAYINIKHHAREKSNSNSDPIYKH